jgi:hypothetical protein
MFGNEEHNTSHLTWKENVHFNLSAFASTMYWCILWYCNTLSITFKFRYSEKAPQTWEKIYPKFFWTYLVSSNVKKNRDIFSKNVGLLRLSELYQLAFCKHLGNFERRRIPNWYIKNPFAMAYFVAFFKSQPSDEV